MFFLFSSFKLVGIVVAFVVVGVLLMPTEVLFAVVGSLTLVGGIVVCFKSLMEGIIMIVLGGAMIGFAIYHSRRLERELHESAEETAKSIQRSSQVYFPPED